MCCNKRRVQHHRTLAALAAKPGALSVHHAISDDSHQRVNGKIEKSSTVYPNDLVGVEKDLSVADDIQVEQAVPATDPALPPLTPPLTPPPSYITATEGGETKTDSNKSVQKGDLDEGDFFSSLPKGSAASRVTAVAADKTTVSSTHRQETATIRVQLEGRGIPRLLRALKRPTSSWGSCCSSYDEAPTLEACIAASSSLSYPSFLSALAMDIMAYVDGLAATVEKEPRTYKERWVTKRALDAKKRLHRAGIAEVTVDWEGLASGRRTGGCCGSRRARRAGYDERVTPLQEAIWIRARDAMARRGWNDRLIINLEEE